jgi:hypothetical protein
MKFASIVNGLLRMKDESSGISIYDETLELVASGPGAGQIIGPITTGTPITLPGSKTFTGEELEVYLNGKRLSQVFEYDVESSTSISFTFNLEVRDLIRFRIDRTA